MPNFIFLPERATDANGGIASPLAIPSDTWDGNTTTTLVDQSLTDGNDRYRSWSPNEIHVDGTLPEFVDTRVGPGRAMMHPAGPVEPVLHPSLFWMGGGTTGAHGELVQSVASPRGDQTPYGYTPQTWRAMPAPHDADQYMGWTPAQPNGDDR